MAFPQVASITETTDADGGDPVVLNLPAIVDAGDLLIACVAQDNNSGNLTDPSGWTRLGYTTGSERAVGLFYRIADGSEGGGTVSFDFQFAGGIQVSCGQVYRITGWHGTTPPEVSTVDARVTDEPDPGSVTASWGSADNLFIVFLGTGDDQSTVMTWPTNYATGQTSTAVGALDGAAARVHSARRELAAATDDPSAFLLSVGEGCGCWTLVVRPAAGGGTTGRGRLIGGKLVGGNLVGVH